MHIPFLSFAMLALLMTGLGSIVFGARAMHRQLLQLPPEERARVMNTTTAGDRLVVLLMALTALFAVCWDLVRAGDARYGLLVWTMWLPVVMLWIWQRYPARLERLGFASAFALDSRHGLIVMLFGTWCITLALGLMMRTL